MPQDLLLDLLLVLNMIVCLLLIGTVLLQRSEGGAFGTGGPTGLVTARGAGDLLTRTTWTLFSLFLGLSLALTLLGGHERSSQAFLNSLKNTSINPDAIAHQPPPATTTTPTQPATQPATAPSGAAGAPSLALPPVAGAAPARQAAHPAHKSTPPVISSPPPAPTTTAPAANPSLALPPIGGSQSAPSNQPPTH